MMNDSEVKQLAQFIKFILSSIVVITIVTLFAKEIFIIG